MTRRAAAMLLAAAALAGCRVSLSPLQNRIAVGRESYVVFVADGEAGQGDLFAVLGQGGPVTRMTYTRLDESAPALAPDGGALAFVRSVPGREEARVAVMNLLNGAEREARLPDGVGPARRLGWSDDGGVLYVETARARLRMAAPPARPVLEPVPPAEAAAADSALAVLLGEPPFARAVPCPEGPGLCVATADGGGPLAREGRDPLRWGGDSVAYLVGDRLEVRPLGAGSARRPAWEGAPANPRQPTAFAEPPPGP